MLVQLRPNLLAGLPDHPAETAPGVAHRGDKQARLLVAIASWYQGGCAFAVIDLHLLTGEKGQAVKLLGLFVAQLGDKAFDGVVGAGVAVRVDQVLRWRWRRGEGAVGPQ